jgi:hypothetical protein
MEEKQQWVETLREVLGDKGCGLSGPCEEAEIYQNEEGWKMRLEGFMEPWALGTTLEEAQAALREHAKMGFGLH